MEFGRIVLQVNAHWWTETDFDMTSHFTFKMVVATAYVAASRRLPTSQPSACDVMGSLYAL